MPLPVTFRLVGYDLCDAMNVLTFGTAFVTFGTLFVFVCRRGRHTITSISTTQVQ